MIDSPIDCPLAGAEGARLPDSSFGNQNEVPRPLLGLGGRPTNGQLTEGRWSGAFGAPPLALFLTYQFQSLHIGSDFFFNSRLRRRSVGSSPTGEGGPGRRRTAPIALFFFYISPVGWGEY